MQMHPKEKLGRVILTASWFNNINMGYGFHTSTVCHIFCNNVMYISEENLDISGSAWKKCHADMAFLLARNVLVLKLYKARAVFTPCKHQHYTIWYCGPVYHPRRTHNVTITPPLRQNNVVMTFAVIMTLLLRHLYVGIYITFCIPRIIHITALCHFV